MIKVSFNVADDGTLEGETEYVGDIFQLTAELIQIINDLANRVTENESEKMQDLIAHALRAAIGIEFDNEKLTRMRDFTMAISVAGDGEDTDYTKTSTHLN